MTVRAATGCRATSDRTRIGKMIATLFWNDEESQQAFASCPDDKGE